MTKHMDGFVVVVTGASTGLGRAIAVQAAEEGAAAIVINYASNLTDAEETARQCQAHGAKTTLVQGDVAKDEDCRKIAEAAAPHGRIDALFNNAGQTVFANHADMDAVSADDFTRIYGVNVVGPFQMVRAARALLRKAGPRAGAVVNTASIAGVTGIGSSVPYAASKRRARHHDLVVVAGAGAEDPGERHLSRLHRHPLVRPRHAGGGGRPAAARTREISPRRCRPLPSRRTSPARRSSSPRQPPTTSPARPCWWTPARTSAAPRSPCAEAAARPLRPAYAPTPSFGSIPNALQR